MQLFVYLYITHHTDKHTNQICQLGWIYMQRIQSIYTLVLDSVPLPTRQIFCLKIFYACVLMITEPIKLFTHKTNAFSGLSASWEWLSAWPLESSWCSGCRPCSSVFPHLRIIPPWHTPLVHTMCTTGFTWLFTSRQYGDWLDLSQQTLFASQLPDWCHCSMFSLCTRTKVSKQC
jgi:hypothetical protein